MISPQPTQRPVKIEFKSQNQINKTNRQRREKTLRLLDEIRSAQQEMAAAVSKRDK
ncbi:RNAse (barnase) inhibitor barstar [Paenibacillus mucilaginosus]|uniref:hypothetical protein n=1 Tax=Paenibacillus mucilaginosus TaxID=61624 RepID=UPI003D236E62